MWTTSKKALVACNVLQEATTALLTRKPVAAWIIQQTEHLGIPLQILAYAKLVIWWTTSFCVWLVMLDTIKAERTVWSVHLEASTTPLAKFRANAVIWQQDWPSGVQLSRSASVKRDTLWMAHICAMSVILATLSQVRLALFVQLEVLGLQPGSPHVAV
jgi:hypothetical protein